MPLAVVSAVTHFTGPGVERRLARREPGLHDKMKRRGIVLKSENRRSQEQFDFQGFK